MIFALKNTQMQLQEILKKLVSFNVLGGESNLAIVSWIENYLDSYGIISHRVYNDDKTKASLHCVFGPLTDGGVVLSGHLDVVPVEGQNWDTNPFELIAKGDGNLYGRGSCDMKGFVACCLAIVPQLVKANLKKPIFFAFSYDEEIGCLGAPDLIDAILDFYNPKPQFAIIGEPTLLQPVIGQKGICVLETTVNGSAGHSSRILQEVSAVHEAAKLVVWLENKIKSLIESGSVDPRFNPPHTSIHVGQFNGGIAPNIIADKARFLWDVRCIPKDTVAKILKDFEAYCATVITTKKVLFPDFTIETKMQSPAVPPLDTSETSEILKLTQKITNKQSFETVSYAAEAGQFSERGIESIICGPGSIAQAHRENEFVAIRQLDECKVMLENLMNEFS
ncbi:acetylornithine deacetylase [Flavobacteriaceae bacterium]|nr:acetylornithine deacetylase [Flavobacteriaceae bacterium]